VTQVHWTPVFTRGKLSIFVCNPNRAAEDGEYPAKLNDSENLAKFVRNILPGILQDMQNKYGWKTRPRTLVHDKASYMVANKHERLNVVFAGALRETGLVSWVGGNDASAKWLAPKWGDVYLHETVISHIRRLLENTFACERLYETPSQFARRVQKVEDHLNSAAFASKSGGGLESLARGMRARCAEVIRLKGERIPK
jgi:hypothetical protein